MKGHAILKRTKQLITILFCGYRRLEIDAETYTRLGTSAPASNKVIGKSTLDHLPLQTKLCNHSLITDLRFARPKIRGSTKGET
jgi:hypothetical protein